MAKTRKTSIAEEIYQKLKREILEAELPPGSLASEPELAVRLGASRTPVHEALRQLESEGLIELIPRRGARILPLSHSDAREIYQLLSALDPIAAGEVANQKPSSDDLSVLSEATDEMEKALVSQNLEEWAANDDRFHRELIRLSGNRRLATIVNRLFDQAHRAQLTTLRLRQSLDKSVKEHRSILRALSSGNVERAKSQAQAHRERGSEEILHLLELVRLPVI